jgi:hypothetical protein
MTLIVGSSYEVIVGKIIITTLKTSRVIAMWFMKF